MNCPSRLAMMAAICVLPGVASSQWYDYSANVNIMLNNQYVMAMDANLLNARNRAADQAKERPAKAASSNAASLSFDPSKTVARQTRKTFLANLARDDPPTAKQYGEVLEHQDVRGHFRATLEALDMDANNLADVLSVYWLTLWAIANKKPTESFDGPASGAVSKAVRTALQRDTRFSNLSSNELQAVADLMIYDTVLAKASYDNARSAGRDDLVSQLSDAVQRRVKAQGMDLRSVTLSGDGFQPH